MTTPTRSVSNEQQVYRALASPVRARVLEVLRDESELDAATLAERLGLHVNTVRTHLNLLEEAGLVEVIVEDRDRPGRPKLLYRPAADSGLSPGPAEGGYRFLAQIMASYLDAISEDTSTAAEQAGRAWGSFLAAKPIPFSEPDAEEAVTHLMGMLEEFGFAPKLDQTDHASPEIVLHRCPFLDVAREHQEVVCSIHLGLMRGAVAQLDASVEVRDLIPWARPGACVSHLEIATPPG